MTNLNFSGIFWAILDGEFVLCKKYTVLCVANNSSIMRTWL
uniref:Uncharacterized protein n=1 Tax=Siphoviridae sp. ctFn287 TaxID=2826215 RepID=A0A8S5LVJ8_9CAUD|nr:MAG TPA: hypothetical protein [Siphoviridae sp. ctFn287]